MSRVIFKICFSRSCLHSRATRHISEFYFPADTLLSHKTVRRVLGYTTVYIMTDFPQWPCDIYIHYEAILKYLAGKLKLVLTVTK